MRMLSTTLIVCSLYAFQFANAAEIELLVAAKDSPAYQLSDFRTEIDQFGSRILSLKFQRTRKGSEEAVSVRGRTKSGYLLISAEVPASRESGTIQLKTFLPIRKEDQVDLEVFLAQTHDWQDGKTRYAVVSNLVRIGNPGAPLQPRAWTAEEEKSYEKHKRMMADDTAQKPRKSYPVAIDVPSDSQFIPENAKVAPQTPLEACFQSKWHPLTALSENGDGSINVRWDTFGAKYDCSMLREELIVKKAFLVKGADGQLTTLPKTEIEKRGIVGLPAKPRKSYPVSIAVPSHSQFVPKDATLKAGTRLQACYAGKWNPITMLSHNSDGSLNVRWDEYGPVFDCSMIREELIVRKSVLESLREPLASPLSKEPELRTWTDITGKFTIKAKLLLQTDTTVTLLNEAGREISLPIEKLSAADRGFLGASSNAGR